MRRRDGFSLIEILVTLGIFAVLIGLLMPAVQAVRQAADRATCRNNLRQIGLALQLYHGTWGAFPSGYVYVPADPASTPARLFDRPGSPLLSFPNGPGWGWAALLLPYLEMESLYQSLNLDLSVESPTNQAGRLSHVPLYTCPADLNTGVFSVLSGLNLPFADAMTNSYAGCFGAGGLLNTQPDDGTGVLFRNSRVRTKDVADGLSTTFAVGERCALLAQTPWAGVMTGGTVRTTPGAPVYTSIVELAPTMALARIGGKPLNDPYCEPYDFFSPHGTVVYFVFADGSVHGLSTAASTPLLIALATRAYGDVIDEGF